MKKNIVKKLGVMVLAGVMLLSAVGCGKNSSETSTNDVSNVVASDGEMFKSETLDAGQVKLMDKVLDLPADYSRISKKLTLREEMTEKYNVKVPANSELKNVFLDVYNKPGYYLTVTLKNSRSEDDLPKACQISGIVAQAGYADASVITLPGNISIGSTAYEISNLYGTPDKTIETSDGFTYVYEKGNFSYSFDFNKDVEGVYMITIE